jgi:hypothetical protein
MEQPLESSKVQDLLHATWEHMKHFIDLAATGIGISALFDLLPHVSAGLSVIWLVLRIRGEWQHQQRAAVEARRHLMQQRKTDL